MAVEVVMPRLGWTMQEGTLVEWLARNGARVEVGDMLFTVESDKAITEVESLDAGILHIPDGVPGEGATAPVGTLLGYLLAEGESPPAAPSSTPGSAAVAGAAAAPGVVDLPENSAAATGADAPAEKPAPAGKPSVSGDEAPRVRISPRALRLAEKLGVDWSKLSGSGGKSRITEADVYAAASEDG